jgi:hypothetical protein
VGFSGYAMQRHHTMFGIRHNKISWACLGRIRSSTSSDTATVEKRAADRATDIAPTIAALQARGAKSLRAIANGLNAGGIPTARGRGQWTAVQVKRVLDRLAELVKEHPGRAAGSRNYLMPEL